MDQIGHVVGLMWNGLKAIYRFLRHVVPPLWKVLVAAAVLLYGTLVSVCKGLKPQIDQIAQQVKDDLSNYVDIRLHGVLNWFSTIVAYLTVILGFVLLSHVTVWVWRWLWSFH